MTGHFGQKPGLAKYLAVFVFVFVFHVKNILTNSIFLLFLEIKKFFPHSRIFKDHDPNLRPFQGLENFPPNSRTFQDFQGPWQPCCSIFSYDLQFNHCTTYRSLLRTCLTPDISNQDISSILAPFPFDNLKKYKMKVKPSRVHGRFSKLEKLKFFDPVFVF